MTLAPLVRTPAAMAAVGLALAAAAGCSRVMPDSGAGSPTAFPELRGPYLGQRPPGPEPEIFAPGIVSTGLDTRDVAMTPDGRELYFSVTVAGTTAILVTRDTGERWSEPAVAPFCDSGLNVEPCVSPDGGTFMFLSTRPRAGEDAKPGWAHQNIWAMDRMGSTWGEPYDIGPPVNTKGAEYYPSLTRDGALYFTREEGPRKAAIYRSRRTEGRYREPERLPAQVNCGTSQFNAFVAPDESYLVVPVTGRDGAGGDVRYFVVFRRGDDTWSDPVDLGERVNRPGARGWSASVSPDGRYLFFMSSRPRRAEGGALVGATLQDLLRLAVAPDNGSADIYWVDAEFIEDLRPG